jgi:hypothetical protein
MILNFKPLYYIFRELPAMSDESEMIFLNIDELET